MLKPLHGPEQDSQTCTVVWSSSCWILPPCLLLLFFFLSWVSSVRCQGHIYLKALLTFLCSISSPSFICINPRRSFARLVPPWCMFLSRSKLTQEKRSMEENELFFSLRNIIFHPNYFGSLLPEDKENLYFERYLALMTEYIKNKILFLLFLKIHYFNCWPYSRYPYFHLIPAFATSTQLPQPHTPFPLATTSLLSVSMDYAFTFFC